MSEKYIKWVPIEPVPFPLDLENLHKDDKGLSILLNSEDHTDKFLHIRFSDYEALREMGEEFKTRFWHEVEIEEDYPLFIVENSEWLEWFHVQSDGNFRDLDIQHYAIWTTENWIDILSSSKPLVRWKHK